MKFFTTLLALAAAVTPVVQAAPKGWNVGANNPDGSCKTTKQWAHAFRKLRHIAPHARNVRLYASSDCNTLARAVPAAKQTGTKVLVGVWTEDGAHYNAEKAALRRAIKKHGRGWILAISVGSEDLYRGNTDANTLAGQIYDVRGMVRAMGVKVPIMHVDTWTAWVNPANNPVIKACDAIGMDAYPYFQGSSMAAAKKTFFRALDQTRRAVHNVGKNKHVWVTETGQPWKGANFGKSHPSVKNAGRYWHEVACTLMKNNVPLFWYAYSDFKASPSFGIFNGKGKAVWNTHC